MAVFAACAGGDVSRETSPGFSPLTPAPCAEDVSRETSGETSAPIRRVELLTCSRGGVSGRVGRTRTDQELTHHVLEHSDVRR